MLPSPATYLGRGPRVCLCSRWLLVWRAPANRITIDRRESASGCRQRELAPNPPSQPRSCPGGGDLRRLFDLLPQGSPRQLCQLDRGAVMGTGESIGGEVLLVLLALQGVGDGQEGVGFNEGGGWRFQF